MDPDIFENMDLSNRNLAGANLQNAVFTNRNLQDANLRGALLSNNDLQFNFDSFHFCKLFFGIVK